VVADPEAEDGTDGRTDAELPAIDFSTFVLSLSTTALYQMGLIADPQTKIELLRAKTRGNLEPDEEKLIDSLLYELRLRFVELDD